MNNNVDNNGHLIISLENNNNASYIADNYLSNNKNIRHLVIDNGICEIGENAFRKCTELKEIQFPNSLQRIGNNAFNFCSSLTSITFPDNIRTISSHTFYNCVNLKSIKNFGHINTIHSCTFSGCVNLEEINLKESSVIDINAFSFYNCRSIERLIMSASLLTIGKKAFGECVNLKEIDFNENISGIANDAFENCNNIKIICIPTNCNDLQLITPFVFNNFNNITLKYEGTKDQWEKNKNRISSDCFKNNKIVFLGDVVNVLAQLIHNEIYDAAETLNNMNDETLKEITNIINGLIATTDLNSKLTYLSVLNKFENILNSKNLNNNSLKHNNIKQSR